MNDVFQCQSCSKESYDTIPTARIIGKLDDLFAKNDLDGVGKLLEYWEREARNLGDVRGLLEILNEEIGYFRRVGNKEKGLSAVYEAFEIVEKNGWDHAVSSGTLYLNGATTIKSFGDAATAMKYYDKARVIYKNTLDADDYKMAAYYNNVSSAYTDLGDLESAIDSCICAIDILKKHEGCGGEIAVSLVNIAHIYYSIDPCDERIYDTMEQAWENLNSVENKHDGNFAFLCSKCYPSFAFFGYFEYEKTLKELVDKIYEGN
jgi:tetratricopeptide (TPR) repeat protein